jgi:hypothetical protein
VKKCWLMVNSDRCVSSMCPNQELEMTLLLKFWSWEEKWMALYIPIMLCMKRFWCNNVWFYCDVDFDPYWVNIIIYFWSNNASKQINTTCSNYTWSSMNWTYFLLSLCSIYLRIRLKFLSEIGCELLWFDR